MIFLVSQLIYFALRNQLVTVILLHISFNNPSDSHIHYWIFIKQLLLLNLIWKKSRFYQVLDNISPDKQTAADRRL